MSRSLSPKEEMKEYQQTKEDVEWMERWGLSGSPKNFSGDTYRVRQQLASPHSVLVEFLKSSNSRTMWSGTKGQTQVMDLATAHSLSQSGIVRLLKVLKAVTVDHSDPVRLFAAVDREDAAFECAVVLPSEKELDASLPFKLPFKTQLMRAWDRYVRDGILTDWILKYNWSQRVNGNSPVEVRRDARLDRRYSDAIRKNQTRRRILKTLRMWENGLID